MSDFMTPCGRLASVGYFSLSKPPTPKSGPTAQEAQEAQDIVRVFAFGYPAVFAPLKSPTEAAMLK